MRPVFPCLGVPSHRSGTALDPPYTHRTPAQRLFRSVQLIHKRFPHSSVAGAVPVRLLPRHHPIARLHSSPVSTPCSGRGNMGNAPLVTSKPIPKSPLRLVPPVKAEYRPARKPEGRRALENVRRRRPACGLTSRPARQRCPPWRRDSTQTRRRDACATFWSAGPGRAGNPSTLRSPVTEDGQSERGPQPGFYACAPSSCKRHTPIQAGPPHPKSGRRLRECRGFISGTEVILK
jgi:hypothetical protein